MNVFVPDTKLVEALFNATAGRVYTLGPSDIIIIFPPIPDTTGE